MSSDSIRRRPAGRYDPVRSPTLRAALIFGLVFGVVVTFGAVKVYKQYGGLEVSSRSGSYLALSDTAVRISFEVTVRDGKAATCLVRSRDRTGAETGSADVPVPARTDGGKKTELTYVLATKARAVTGEVLRCRLA